MEAASTDEETQDLGEEEKDEAMGNSENVGENTAMNKKRKNTSDDAVSIVPTVPLMKSKKKRQAKARQQEEQQDREEEEKKCMEAVCSELRSNALTELDKHLTEDQAKAIGQALVDNLSLECLDLNLGTYLPRGPTPAIPCLTLAGVQALCDGILQSQLSRLKVHGRFTDANIGQSLFGMLKASQTIRKLVLYDVLEIHSIAYLGQALQNNHCMEELSLFVDSSGVTNSEAQALSLALRQSHITKLRIDCRSYQYNRVAGSTDKEVDTAAAFVTLFEAVQQKMESLEILEICWITERLPLITRLANGLNNSTTLEVLDLRHGKFGDVDALKTLCQGLTQNVSLKTLCLYDYTLKNESLRVLAAHLHQLPHLEVLKIGGFGSCDIGPDGALALVRAVANMPAMRLLNLSERVRLGLAGLKRIGEELPTLRLRELLLSCPRVGRKLFLSGPPVKSNDNIHYGVSDESETVESNNALRQSARHALLQGMSENRYIWKLSVIDETSKECYSCDELKFYQDMNRWGRCMVTTDHGLSPTIWCYILARAACQPKADLPNCLSFVFYVLREQLTQVQGLS